MMKRLAAMIALVGLAAVTASGCNTIQGAGKDVKAAGGAVEKAAEKSKPY